MITEVAMTDMIEIAERTLMIRNVDDGFIPFIANKWQRKYERNHSRNGNLIIKQRQRGMSTWALMRLLLNTVSNKDTTSLVTGVPREHVEIVQRMVMAFYVEKHPALPAMTEFCPGFIHFGSIGSSILFGPPENYMWRGRDIQNVHCLEIGMWDEKKIGSLVDLKLTMRSHRVHPAYDFVVEMTSGTEWNLDDELMEILLDGLHPHFLSFA